MPFCAVCSGGFFDGAEREYSKMKAIILIYLSSINDILTSLLKICNQDIFLPIIYISLLISFITILECFYNLPNFLRFNLDNYGMSKILLLFRELLSMGIFVSKVSTA